MSTTVYDIVHSNNFLILRAHCFIFSKPKRTFVCKPSKSTPVLQSNLVKSRAMLQIRKEQVYSFATYTFEYVLLNIIRVLRKQSHVFKKKNLDRLLVYCKHEVLFLVVCHVYICTFLLIEILSSYFYKIKVLMARFNDKSFIKLYVRNIIRYRFNYRESDCSLKSKILHVF